MKWGFCAVQLANLVLMSHFVSDHNAKITSALATGYSICIHITAHSHNSTKYLSRKKFKLLMKCMEIKNYSIRFNGRYNCRPHKLPGCCCCCKSTKKNTRANDELPFPVYLHASQYTLIYYSTMCNLHHQEKERIEMQKKTDEFT